MEAESRHAADERRSDGPRRKRHGDPGRTRHQLRMILVRI
jgi:hypothetical protein